MHNNITELFCFIDDFCKAFEVEMSRHQLSQNSRKPTRISGLTSSEIITILLMFQTSYRKNFKRFICSAEKNIALNFPACQVMTDF
jgi:hypothetical protein